MLWSFNTHCSTSGSSWLEPRSATTNLALCLIFPFSISFSQTKEGDSPSNWFGYWKPMGCGRCKWDGGPRVSGGLSVRLCPPRVGGSWDKGAGRQPPLWNSGAELEDQRQAGEILLKPRLYNAGQQDFGNVGGVCSTPLQEFQSPHMGTKSAAPQNQGRIH